LVPATTTSATSFVTLALGPATTTFSNIAAATATELAGEQVPATFGEREEKSNKEKRDFHVLLFLYQLFCDPILAQFLLNF
jgi:hypothetical protein